MAFRATRSDGVVLVLTAVVTLTVDLVVAVLVGMLVAGALALASLVPWSVFCVIAGRMLLRLASAREREVPEAAR